MQVSLIISATKPTHSRKHAEAKNGDWVALADNIMANARRLIDELGLKDQEFARRVGVTPQVVSRWLNRKANPGLDVVDRIAEALGVSVEELARDPSTSVVPLPGKDVDTVLRELAAIRGYELRRKPKS
jgi:transcriptional regulator with XRE-family HTH domain